MAVGVAKASLDYAIDYAKDRDAFGVKIAQKQAIAFMIADMATETEAARLLNYEAAWNLDQGNEASREVAIAHRYTADMAMQVTDNGLQVLAYFLTVFVAAPLALITGLGMSPALSTRFKRVSKLLSIQVARSTHFLVLCWFVGFIIVHVALVVTTGLGRHVDEMFAGGALFAVAMLATIWLRNLVLPLGVIAAALVGWVVATSPADVEEMRDHELMHAAAGSAD